MPINRVSRLLRFGAVRTLTRGGGGTLHESKWTPHLEQPAA